MLSQRFQWLQRGLPLVLASLLGYAPLSWANDPPRQHRVIIPQEDRFTPFNLVIRRGDIVKWINRDADDHTVVSNDRFNSAGHRGTNHLLPGTASTGGQPSTFRLRFHRPGTFVYSCRFHAHLDGDQQPVAPGPNGGIQDPSTGNFGTPMEGTITVLPDSD
jgi:plastocyanin